MITALIRWTVSGQLQSFARIAANRCSAAFVEHVVDPLWKLVGGLFDTLRRREGIVSHDDLEQSTKALQRMLDDFALTNGIAQRNVDNTHIIGGINNAVGSIPTTIDNRNDKLDVMECLMRRYESELRSPIRGVLFGSLMSAMLIQVCRNYLELIYLYEERMQYSLLRLL